MSQPPTKKRRMSRAAPPPPEYEAVWEDVYLAGTEWEQQEEVKEYAWDFDHLDESLMTGALSKSKEVHLFGCTEPQLIPAKEGDVNGSIVPIPVIIAVASERPPPATVGIKSVQRAEEEIVEMRKIRMGWHPRPPDNMRAGVAANLHVLKCSERKARLRNMDEAAVHKYDYVLPWILRPGMGGDVEIPDTNVKVLVDALEGRANPLMCDFDWEMDELDEFLEETIKDNDLDEKKHREAVKDAVKAAVKAKKLEQKAEREKRKATIDAISPEDRKSLESMKVYKFYPANGPDNEEDKYPDVSGAKSKYVNRYYGQADEIC